MASTTKDLTPAYGDLHAAVLIMAIRYASSEADWAASLYNGRDADRGRYRRDADRRYRAMGRLLWALDRRKHP